jgi:hypothetical protein
MAPENRTGRLFVVRGDLQDSGSHGCLRTPFPEQHRTMKAQTCRETRFNSTAASSPEWLCGLKQFAGPSLLCSCPRTPRTPTWWAEQHPTGHLIYLTLLFRHFLPSNQVPVGCPKNQKLPFALRPFKFLERERDRKPRISSLRLLLALHSYLMK